MPTYQWIDLVKFDLEKQTFLPVARCILENEVLRFEGSENVVQNLKKEFGESNQDPDEYLKSLIERFNSPYLQATELQSGDELTPFQSPEPVSL